MAIPQQQQNQSWCESESPMILSEIVSPEISVSVWQRPQDDTISDYFSNVFDSLGLGVRRVFSMSTLKEGLRCALPDGEGQGKAIEDIYLLSDMLTCLFDCENVGLRIAPLSSAMCPSFHTDKIPVRLVNTYLGKGTEWVPVEALCDTPLATAKLQSKKLTEKAYYHVDSMQQLTSFDVALLKGSDWEGHEHMAAIHRSCAVAENERRVLLTLDPI